MGILVNILISAAVGLVATIGVYNYLPLSFIEKFGQKYEKNLGVSITTIQATDTLKDSRTTINDNFTALNNGKIENSTTSVASIITLANLTSATSLATVGTITTGVWSGTTLTVSKGGTGSTTLSSNQVLLGNGTGNISVVSGLGSSGQFLTSGGAGTPPTWTTSSVNEATNYNWTGSSTWTSLFASSTVSGYFVSTSTTATSTFNNGLNLLGGCTAKNGVCTPSISTSTASSALSTSDSAQTIVTPICSSGKAISGGFILRGVTLSPIPEADSNHYSVIENIKITDTQWRVTVSCVATGGCIAGTLVGDVVCMNY